MNVTSPINSQATQTTSHTLPIKRNADIPAAGTNTAPSTKTPSSNQAHLGNHVDTTA